MMNGLIHTSNAFVLHNVKLKSSRFTLFFCNYWYDCLYMINVSGADTF